MENHEGKLLGVERLCTGMQIVHPVGSYSINTSKGTALQKRERFSFEELLKNFAVGNSFNFRIPYIFCFKPKA